MVSVTGHRPTGLTPPQQRWARDAVGLTAHRLASAYGTRVAWSGMALGVDTWWAESALTAGLDLHAAIPFTAQADRWGAADRRRWRQLCAAAAAETVLGGDRYDVRMLHARNDLLVSVCDLLVAVVCSTATSGGSVSTLTKARRAGTPVLWIDPVTRSFTRERW